MSHDLNECFVKSPESSLSLRNSEFAKSRCIRASVVYVPTCQCANVSKACQFLIFTCQRAKGVPVIQLGVPTCQSRANISV